MDCLLYRQAKCWPELTALTSIFSVELPGIEAAYNPAELCKR
jgi:hypothetical protein